MPLRVPHDEQYANIFWRKWLAKYMSTLTCGSKRFEKLQNLHQGDLVVIVIPVFLAMFGLKEKLLKRDWQKMDS